MNGDVTGAAPRVTPADLRLRRVVEDDAPALAALRRANRGFLAGVEPERDESFFTAAGQASMVEGLLLRAEAGLVVPCVIEVAGAVVGQVSINDVVRGAFQSAHLGYWLSEDRTGRGIGTAAVAAAVFIAFDEMGLHRLQADTLLDNVASQKVLARNGFTRIGLAPRYLNIAGRWQDHVLHQLLAENQQAPAPAP